MGKYIMSNQKHGKVADECFADPNYPLKVCDLYINFLFVIDVTVLPG
jgi:hypothetical protein